MAKIVLKIPEDIFSINFISLFHSFPTACDIFRISWSEAKKSTTIGISQFLSFHLLRMHALVQLQNFFFYFASFSPPFRLNEMSNSLHLFIFFVPVFVMFVLLLMIFLLSTILLDMSMRQNIREMWNVGSWKTKHSSSTAWQSHRCTWESVYAVVKNKVKKNIGKSIEHVPVENIIDCCR